MDITADLQVIQDEQGLCLTQRLNCELLGTDAKELLNEAKSAFSLCAKRRQRLLLRALVT